MITVSPTHALVVVQRCTYRRDQVKWGTVAIIDRHSEGVASVCGKEIFSEGIRSPAQVTVDLGTRSIVRSSRRCNVNNTGTRCACASRACAGCCCYRRRPRTSTFCKRAWRSVLQNGIMKMHQDVPARRKWGLFRGSPRLSLSPFVIIISCGCSGTPLGLSVGPPLLRVTNSLAVYQPGLANALPKNSATAQTRR